MTTPVTKTIGSAVGRNYPTIADFFAAIPADLVAVDEAWIGELYNDSEFAVGAKITLGAKTTSAACYIMLRPAAGQGFAHHANKLTNALRYNQANGVAINSSTDWDDVFDLTGANDVIVEGLQFKFTAGYWTSGFKLNGARSVLRGNIIDCGSSSSKPFVKCQQGENVYNNVVYYAHCDIAMILDWASAKAYNNTIYIATGGAGTRKVAEGYGTTELKNNLVIGFAESGAIPSGGCQYNATTTAAFTGTNNLLNIVGADQVESLTAGALDFRVKAGAAVIDAGTPIGGITTDILGQARSATTPTIGAVEYVSGGGGGDATATGATLTGTSTLTPGTATGGSGATGSFHFDDCENNTGAGVLDAVAVDWTWISGAVGAGTAIANGAGTMTAAGMTVPGLPLGNGFGVIKTLDGLVVAYQEGTVT